MTAFVLLAVLIAVGLVLAQVRRLIEVLPDSNEDFVFCGEEAAGLGVGSPKTSTVIPGLGVPLGGDHTTAA